LETSFGFYETKGYSRTNGGFDARIGEIGDVKKNVDTVGKFNEPKATVGKIALDETRGTIISSGSKGFGISYPLWMYVCREQTTIEVLNGKKHSIARAQSGVPASQRFSMN